MKLILPDTFLNEKPLEQKLQEIFSTLNEAIEKYERAFIGSIKEQSAFGAQLQWLVIVRLLSELCQHGTEKECKEITDALYKTLVEVCFKDKNVQSDNKI